MDSIHPKSFLPAWNYEEKTLPMTCVAGTLAVGSVFLFSGIVLTTLYRKLPHATDTAMGGVALVVLGLVLVIVGLVLLSWTVWLRMRLPKTSSAAKADVSPDPFSLLPVYPSSSGGCTRPVSTHSSQIVLLPGGIDPVYAPYGT